MNKILLNNKPSDSDNEEFTKAWNNSAYVLEALWKTIDQYAKEQNEVKRDDFDCPNHYAKLAFQAGMLRAYAQIIALLPESAKPT